MTTMIRMGILALLIICGEMVGEACVQSSLYDGRRENMGATVREVEASIVTYASLPDLHGGSSSSVWCMVDGGPTTPYNVYAQAGYTRERNEGDLLVLFAEYTDRLSRVHAEFTPTIGQQTGLPAQGTHTYRCLQDPNTGRWTFYYDDLLFETSPSNMNTSWTGTYVTFSGEVSPDSRVQMMGDSSNRIRFSSLKCRKEGQQALETVWPTELRNGSPDQWAHDANEGAGYFEIYDMTP